VLITALASATACSSPVPTDPPRACTLIGCEDGLHVRLQPDSGWPPGSYRFSIAADGRQAICRGALPLPPCSSGRALTCEPAGMVTIVESGCALPAAAHGFSEIVFDPALRPGTVVVTIERGDDGREGVAASAHIAPEFRTVHPNGVDCPPACTQAQAVVAVRF
jgi:hypothetical protein